MPHYYAQNYAGITWTTLFEDLRIHFHTALRTVFIYRCTLGKLSKLSTGNQPLV